MTDHPLTRASVQTAISTKLAELTRLNNELNVEIYELAERAEAAEERLAAQTAALNRALEGLASFMPRPDIHGALLGLFEFVAEPVDEPEEPDLAPTKPEYDERFAFEAADSCTCHIAAPCSYCVDHPEEP